MRRVLKLTLSYDGTAYVGWQRQPSGVSIQGLIEAALGRLDGAPVAVIGAGRTDAGVHALGQVVSAPVVTGLDAATIRKALNATLPRDVRVVRVEEAPEGFHARYGAISKRYDYRIWDGDIQPPFVRAWSWQGPRRLDLAAMQRAADALVGRHDFSAFQSVGTAVKSAVRTLARAEVAVARVETDAPLVPPAADDLGRLIVCRFEADGFLRHMVRALVGTLVEVGDGRRDRESMAELLASQDRAHAGATAPAHGLVLVSVTYRDAQEVLYHENLRSPGYLHGA
jgi:tRNA pseudouridine38-40 synthase